MRRRGTNAKEGEGAGCVAREEPFATSAGVGGWWSRPRYFRRRAAPTSSPNPSPAPLLAEALAPGRAPPALLRGVRRRRDAPPRRGPGVVERGGTGGADENRVKPLPTAGARSVARRVPAIAVPAAVRLDASASRRTEEGDGRRPWEPPRAKRGGPSGRASVLALRRRPHRSWLPCDGTVTRDRARYTRARGPSTSLLGSRGVSQSLSLSLHGGGGPCRFIEPNLARSPTWPQTLHVLLSLDEGQSRAKPTPPLWHVFPLHPRVRHRGRTRRLRGTAAISPLRQAVEVIGRLVELIVGAAHGHVHARALVARRGGQQRRSRVRVRAGHHGGAVRCRAAVPAAVSPAAVAPVPVSRRASSAAVPPPRGSAPVGPVATVVLSLYAGDGGADDGEWSAG